MPVLVSPALGRIGYEDLLSHTAEAARAMLAADAVYLLAPGEDGELRVRAAAGAGRSGAADLGPLATGTGAGAAAAARDLAEAAKSLVTVPLVADGRITGVLAAAAAEPGHFSDQDSARLQALADRAAPALEEARLGEADRAAEARARFLSEAAPLGSVLDAGPDARHDPRPDPARPARRPAFAGRSPGPAPPPSEPHPPGATSPVSAAVPHDQPRFMIRQGFGCWGVASQIRNGRPGQHGTPLL
jgi:hypothetical protein